MDNINHPAHYNAYKGIEVIDLAEQMNFNRGNAVKYISRAGIKNEKTEIEDLEKAAWYIHREIQRLRGGSEADGHLPCVSQYNSSPDADHICVCAFPVLKGEDHSSSHTCFQCGNRWGFGTGISENPHQGDGGLSYHSCNDKYDYKADHTCECKLFILGDYQHSQTHVCFRCHHRWGMGRVSSENKLKDFLIISTTEPTVFNPEVYRIIDHEGNTFHIFAKPFCVFDLTKLESREDAEKMIEHLRNTITETQGISFED